MMSKNLILVITIFSFWLYIYLTNIKEEQEKEKKNKSVDDLSVGQGQRVNYQSELDINSNVQKIISKNYVTSPVPAKGGN